MMQFQRWNLKYLWGGSKTSTWTVLAGIVLLGFCLRLFHLGYQSLWSDELQTAASIRFPLSTMMQEIERSPHVPLYYLFMRIWSSFFGHSEAALRFPSLVFSVLTIIGIYKISETLYDKKTGILAAFLLCLSPYSIYYAQEAKMYTLLWACMIGSFYSFYQLIRTNRLRYFFSYIFASTVGVYTHYTALMFIAVCIVSSYFLYENKKQIVKWVLANVLVGLLFLPWVGIFLNSASNRYGLTWITSNSFEEVLFVLFSKILGRFQYKPANPSTGLEILFFGAVMLSYFVTFKKESPGKIGFRLLEQDVLLLTWIVLPLYLFGILQILSYPLLGVGSSRYGGLIHIPMMILLSRGILRYRIPWRQLFVFCTVLLFSFNLSSLYGKESKMYPQNWPRFFRELNRHTDSPTLILTPHFEIDYYNTERHPIRYCSDFEAIEKIILEKKPGSFFVVFSFSSRDISNLCSQGVKGYELSEKHFDKDIGFLKFSKTPK